MLSAYPGDLPGVLADKGVGLTITGGGLAVECWLYWAAVVNASGPNRGADLLCAYIMERGDGDLRNTCDPNRS